VVHSFQVVKQLLLHRANEEHSNVSDYTCLSLATSGGCINILLNAGTEINSWYDCLSTPDQPCQWQGFIPLLTVYNPPSPRFPLSLSVPLCVFVYTGYLSSWGWLQWMATSLRSSCCWTWTQTSTPHRLRPTATRHWPVRIPLQSHCPDLRHLWVSYYNVVTTSSVCS
jgi:hypothetical protein